MNKKTVFVGWGACLCAFAAFALIEQEGVAYVGFSVAPLSNAITILDAPYVNFTNAAQALPATKLVSVTGLTSSDTAENADQLVVYTPSTNPPTEYGTYRYYWLQKDSKGDLSWIALKTIIACRQTEEGADPSDLGEVPVNQGAGFWLEKAAEGSSTEAIVKGRVYTNQATVVGKGLNLIGNGYPTPFVLNNCGQKWDADMTNDEILVDAPGERNMDRYYLFEEDGSFVWKKRIKEIDKSKAIPKVVVSYTNDNLILPDGIGFWYRRKKSGSNFTFNPVPIRPEPAPAQ